MHATEEQQMKAKGMTTFDGDGLHLTANGELRILIVFVRFPNDSQTLPNNWWPIDDDPNILNNIIDTDTSVGSTHKHNLTHYFKVMSRSDYDVVGDAISVEAPQTVAGYNYDLGDASKDVLDYISDNNLATFANYDSWTANGIADNDEISDDLVDMVLMVWKGSNFVPGEVWGGCAAMYKIGGCTSFPNTPETNPGTLAVNGGKDIEFGFGAGNGSGVTAFAYSDVRTAFNIMTHEIAHWLLGSGHPYSSGGNTSDNRVASLLSATHSRSISVNASERERLGWDVVPEITTDLTNRELRDYLTKGDAYKFKVPGGGTHEYYYIENHQKESIYDDATMDDTDKGIFILHTNNATVNTPNIRYLNSDGDWDWANISPYSISGTCCGTVPLFGKINADPDNGENYMTKMYADNYDSEWHWPHGYKDENGNDTLGGYYRGDEDFDLKGSYNTSYGTLFSSHTNPKPKSWSGIENSFALKIDSLSGNSIYVDFYTNYDPYTITENTKWDGQIFLEEDTEVDNNSTLTILPGTTVYLSENVILRIEPGSKIIAEGTQSEPIRFMRADPAGKWNKIHLRSSTGNSFEWVVFDGGDRNVEIASKNNTFKHITSRNGWRGISGWHNADGTGNSEAEISYALIEDNTSVGVVSHYMDLDMSYTTIRNNAQAGLYISSNTVYPFHHNVISGNGGTSRDGIEIVSSSGVLYMQGSGYSEGYNQIHDNGDDQISNSGDLIVGNIYPLTGGYNSLEGSYGGSNYFVDNNTGTTVYAEYVWWDQYPAHPDMTDGPVLYDQHMQTSDPTLGQNPGEGGQTPSKQQNDKSLLREEQYEQATTYLSEWDGNNLTGHDRKDYLSLKATVETYHGAYESALKSLEELYAFQSTLGEEDMEKIKAQYAPLEEDIRQRMTEGGSSGATDDREKTHTENTNELTAQNYPNPFNPTTNIRFSLPERSKVTLVVYDMLGREVATLVNGVLSAGQQTVSFDASNLSNGMYLYKLRAGGQEIVNKMTLIK